MWWLLMSQTKENNEKSLKQHQKCFQNVILFASNGIGNNQVQAENKTKDVEPINITWIANAAPAAVKT